MPINAAAMFAKDGPRELSRGQLLRAATATSLSLSREVTVYIAPCAPLDYMTLVLAAMLARVPCVLGWNPQSAVLLERRVLRESDIVAGEDAVSRDAASIDVASLDAQVTSLATSAAPNLFFHTSGSTGEAKLIPKSWSSLLAEAAVLIDLLPITAEDRVCSLVPMWHIYGCLYAFLVPLLSGASVQFSLQREPAPEATAFITVPSLWPLVLQHLAPPLRLIVSSGAPLSDRALADFAATGSTVSLLDILGSTESGGIGYREFSRVEGRVYRALPGVILSAVAATEFPAAPTTPTSEISLSSPFTFPPHDPVLLSDRIELLEAPLFAHLGRRDRIIKYASTRHSLSEIEDHLREVLPQRKLVCFFKADESAKGGELLCFMEGGPVDVMATRLQYTARFATPFPHRVIVVPTLENAIGKMSLAELENARSFSPPHAKIER